MSIRNVALLLASLGSFAGAHIKVGSLDVASGTTWTPGQKVTLSWAASIDHGKSPYDLWYSVDGGATWTTIQMGIPGQAADVPVTWDWTVPDKPTTRGMIRVFQTFGGTVASSPSNPGDYTLFSPLFTIQATTAVEPAAAGSRAMLHQLGDALRIGLPAGSASAALEIVRLDGTRPVRIPLDAGAAQGDVVLPLRGPAFRAPFLARLVVDGRVSARLLVTAIH
jgi:hypothetical protein